MVVAGVVAVVDQEELENQLVHVVVVEGNLPNVEAEDLVLDVVEVDDDLVDLILMAGFGKPHCIQGQQDIVEQEQVLLSVDVVAGVVVVVVAAVFLFG